MSQDAPSDAAEFGDARLLDGLPGAIQGSRPLALWGETYLDTGHRQNGIIDRSEALGSLQRDVVAELHDEPTVECSKSHRAVGVSRVLFDLCGKRPSPMGAPILSTDQRT